MERAVLPLRKARTDRACRAFIRDKVVPALRNQPERMMNTRVLYPALGLDSGGRESEGLKPNQKLFEQFIGGGQSFTSTRTFDTVFPDMFQVRIYSANLRMVKMIRDTLPEPETDPPDKNEVKGLTSDDLIREVMGLYREDIEREIRDNHDGEWTLGRLGVWLAQRPGWEERKQTASLGQKGTKAVLEALGFRISGPAGPGAKVRNP